MKHRALQSPHNCERSSPVIFSCSFSLHGRSSQAVKAKLAVRFAEMDAVLSRSDFLAGRYSVADAYGFTIVNWSNLLGIPLTAYPHLQAWMARVAARPQVQAALRAEGLLS